MPPIAFPKPSSPLANPLAGKPAFGFSAFLRCVFALICGLAVLATSPRAEDPSQLKPQGYVNDFAGVLSQSARDQLTALCTEVDQKAQAQIAVVTVKSLDGRPIEDFSIDLATRWGIGPKQKDRGVLILLAVDDHQYRFEVGFGLEPILPDGLVGSFGREAAPYLKQGNYDNAVLLMTRRVADVIAADRGVTLSGPPPASPSEPETFGQTPTVFKIITVLGMLFVVWLFFRLLFGIAGQRGGRGGGWWIGPMIGGGGWGGGGFGGGGGAGGGFGGFGGGSFGGGGASGGW